MHFSTISEFTELPWRIRSDMGFQQLLQFCRFRIRWGSVWCKRRKLYTYLRNCEIKDFDIRTPNLNLGARIECGKVLIFVKWSAFLGDVACYPCLACDFSLNGRRMSGAMRP